MTSQLDLSLVLPCYNEGPHFEQSVGTLLDVLNHTSLTYEIFFVDDKSQDNTRELIGQICEKNPQCRTHFHTENKGRGAAFKTGFQMTSGQVTGFIDIDLEIHALYIPYLVGLILTHHYDMSLGRRYYVLNQTGVIHRHILSHAYRKLSQLMLGIDFHDTETGCKFFQKRHHGAHHKLHRKQWMVLGHRGDRQSLL